MKLLKCADTRHKAYSRVCHSVDALALQEGEASERAKFRARLVAKEQLAFKCMCKVFGHGLGNVVYACHDCIG